MVENMVSRMDGGTPGAKEFAGRVTSGSEPTLCVAPPRPVTTAVIEELYTAHGETATPPTETREEPDARVLYPADRLEGLFRDFCLATRAAELIERNALAIRRIDRVTQRVTVTDEEAYAHVSLNGRTRALSVSEASFTRSIRETYERQWDASESVSVSAPPRATFVRTFRDSFPEAAETLAEALSGDVSVARSDELDPVTVTTLVAARHGIQTLQLSEWAEDIGFSSRTELSRVTNRLTDRGLVSTERVPHGVGRPRQRLRLADERLESCSPDEFVRRARESYHAEEV